MSRNKSSIASFVENKFLNSTIIQNRKTITGNKKYYDEEVQYWVNQVFESDWSESLFNLEFDNTYNINHGQSLSTIDLNDYVGQTFKIDSVAHPRGIYVNAINIFTAIEDNTAPITIDIRKLVNGVPSSIAIPMSIKTLYPSFDRTNPLEVIPWDPSSEIKASVRNFHYEFPIYLEPGYYCFTLKTPSSNYSVYIAENGKGTLNTGKTVVNPYLGDFIYSGQGESWVIDPTRDLCFILEKCDFTVGTKKLYLNTSRSNFQYDLMSLTTKALQIPDVAYISDSYATVYEFGTLNDSKIQIFPDSSNIVLPSHSTADVLNGVQFTLELTNTDPDTTPVLDMHKTGVALVRNYIDPYSETISNSELTPNGLAFAKYMTKAITLNENFDADGITVYVDVNKPFGTDIEVFYRVLNKYDPSIAFADSDWYRLPKKSTDAPTQLSVDYAEETYEQLNLTYVGKNGELYNSFNQLAVKVVFYSDDSTKVPQIKNLRVIATV